MIVGVLCLAFSASSLVWEDFWRTYVILFATSMVVAAYGIFSNKHHSGAVVPLAVLSTSLCFMIITSGALTYIDYQSKCIHNHNLSQRSLQNAYEFGCGWRKVFLWLWSVVLLCSAGSFFLVGYLSFSIVRKYDKYQRIMGRAVWGGTWRQGHVPVLAAYLVAVVFVGVCVIMLMVSSLAGHKTGHVKGACPTGNTFFVFPQYNDVGCCEWATASGTCCQQSICDNFVDYAYSNSQSSTCSNLVGLLQCATCHPNSGQFATSLTNITICDSFCTQMYDACNSKTQHNSSVQFCRDTFHVEVTDSASGMCFNSALAVSPALTLFVTTIAFVLAYSS